MAKAFSLGFQPADPTATAIKSARLPAAPGASVLDRVSDQLADLLPDGLAVNGRAMAGVGIGLLAVVAGVWAAGRVVGSRQAAAPAGARPVALARDARRSAPVEMPPTVALASLTLPARPVLPADPVRPAVVDDAPAILANEPADVSAAGDDPQVLMSAGLAAEAKGDYAAAVQHYERLESLSSRQWPAGLRDRLKLARSAARGD